MKQGVVGTSLLNDTVHQHVIRVYPEHLIDVT